MKKRNNKLMATKKTQLNKMIFYLDVFRGDEQISFYRTHSEQEKFTHSTNVTLYDCSTKSNQKS